ncbi:MAG: hypothetical protein AAGB51_06200 [Planctomycetota bacterium]
MTDTNNNATNAGETSTHDTELTLKDAVAALRSGDITDFTSIGGHPLSEVLKASGIDLDDDQAVALVPFTKGDAEDPTDCIFALLDVIVPDSFTEPADLPRPQVSMKDDEPVEVGTLSRKSASTELKRLMTAEDGLRRVQAWQVRAEKLVKAMFLGIQSRQASVQRVAAAYRGFRNTLSARVADLRNHIDQDSASPQTADPKNASAS